MLKELLRFVFFDEVAALHEHDAGCHLAGEAHLMGNHDHRHVFLGKLAHYV